MFKVNVGEQTATDLSEPAQQPEQLQPEPLQVDATYRYIPINCDNTAYIHRSYWYPGKSCTNQQTLKSPGSTSSHTWRPAMDSRARARRSLTMTQSTSPPRSSLQGLRAFLLGAPPAAALSEYIRLLLRCGLLEHRCWWGCSLNFGLMPSGPI